MNRINNENYNKCILCEDNIPIKKLECSHLKKDNTRICCYCFYRDSKKSVDLLKLKASVDKNCFKCNKSLPQKECYFERWFYGTAEGNKAFCDDCALSESQNVIYYWVKKTPQERYQDVKGALRVRNEPHHNCVWCNPNAKKCPQCNSAFTDKGCTCEVCEKVFCSCCCMSRAPKCQPSTEKNNFSDNFKPNPPVSWDEENLKCSECSKVFRGGGVFNASFLDQAFCSDECHDSFLDKNIKSNPGSERKIKVIGGENNSEKKPANPAPEQSPLIISLRDIRKIYLTSNECLVIEFNNSTNRQIINSEEVNRNSELQRIKSYCRENQKNNLSQQELNSIFSTSTGNSNNNDNKAIWIGCSIGVALGIIGTILFSKRKRRVKKE